MAVTTTQFKLFGEPEVNKVRKARRKMSEREKEERREKKALEKRLAADKEFERKWAERGVFQGQLFADDTEKQGVDENKMKRNMKKKLVRLTENDLHRIVKESVGKVLNESCWYGDTKPFETICAAASEIRKAYEYAGAEDYDPWDDCDGRDLAPEIYRWAKKVEDESEDWIRYNTSNTAINGGEGW